MSKFDLILKGGRLLDPANELDGYFDLGISSGQVAEVEAELDPGQADAVMDMSGRWVLPGVIDSHVHVATSGGNVGRALGYRQMAEAGVTTAIDFAGTMAGIIPGMQTMGAGLNIGSLFVLDPGFTVPDANPSADVLRDTLRRALGEGSLGLKCMGGHNPMTPEATARAIEVCNQAGAYVAFHCGTKATSSNLEGLREVPDLVGNGRLHVAHVNAYCRGMVLPSGDECREALEMLSNMKEQLVSEVHLAVPNCTSGRCQGDDVADFVTRNCLLMRDYPLTRTGLRQAMEDGYASVVAERDGRVTLISGDEAVAEWEAARTEVTVSFPVGVPQAAFNLAVAKDETGEFIIDAVSTDGGYLPRNISVQRTWAMTRLEALTPLEMSAKLSWNPARMFGLTTKGHLSPGADADVTVVDPATGAAVMSLVAGDLVMKDGQSLGQGGTLLITSEGEASARRTGLGYQVVDLSQSKLYQGYG
ncbi:MAG: amidohydrolase family protein [Chloroflexi bacterium]|nr:amidohydrolase family protein [Chloroflexota bacterium]